MIWVTGVYISVYPNASITLHRLVVMDRDRRVNNMIIYVCNESTNSGDDGWIERDSAEIVTVLRVGNKIRKSSRFGRFDSTQGRH